MWWFEWFFSDHSSVYVLWFCQTQGHRGTAPSIRFLPYKKQLRNSLLQLAFDPPSVQTNPRHSHTAALLVSSLLSAYLTFQPEEKTLLWHLFGALGFHITNSCCHSNTLAFIIAPDLAYSKITGFLLKRQSGSKKWSAGLSVSPLHRTMVCTNGQCMSHGKTQPKPGVCHLCHSVN